MIYDSFIKILEIIKKLIHKTSLIILNILFFSIIRLNDMVSLKDMYIYLAITIFFIITSFICKHKKYIFFVLMSIYDYVFMELCAFENVRFEKVVKTFFFNCLLIFLLLIFIYKISNNLLLSIFVVELITILLGIANYYLIIYRERGLYFSDIFSIKTALGVVESYDLRLNSFLFFLICYICIFSVLYIKLIINKSDSKIKLNYKRQFTGGLAVFILIVFLYNSNVLNYLGYEVYWWSLSQNNGFLLGFILQAENYSIQKDISYSTEEIENLVDKYKITSNSGDTPDIIIVMNESFSDLSVIGELKTNQEVTPYLNSLKENCIKGNLYTSVKAGNTANSEYEFLTGGTMAYYQYGLVPYISHMEKEISSNVSYLKNMGYEVQAFHPWYQNGWNREVVYQNLGFDKSTFIEDLESVEYLRVYPSDSYNYTELNNIYNSMSEGPRFIFNVTMQNHAAYDLEYGEIEQKVRLIDDMEDYSLVTQYLSLVHESDIALETLISQYKDLDRKVIICFFGDHQPGLEKEFFEELYDKSMDSLSLEEEQKQYITPFLIWANYDIEEEYIDKISANYLFAFLMKIAGIETSPFQNYLLDLYEQYPVINSIGAVDNKGIYYSHSKIKEIKEIQNYYNIIYNQIIDTKHTVIDFFE